MTNSDGSKITQEQAIDRLTNAQPVFARFRDGLTDQVTSILDSEVFALNSARALADVDFFSSIDESMDFDFEALETTTP